MSKIHMRDEIIFTAPTRVGLLADVTEKLNAVGVNILAIGAYDKGDNGELLMITDDNQRAAEALSVIDGSIAMRKVVVAEVANEPGQLADIARKLAEHDINVSQIFATTADGADKVLVVITADCEFDVISLLIGEM